MAKIRRRAMVGESLVTFTGFSIWLLHQYIINSSLYLDSWILTSHPLRSSPLPCFSAGSGSPMLTTTPSSTTALLGTSKRGGYNVNLQSIAVNGNIVQVDPAMFESKKDGIALVDTSTTLTMLAENAYDPVISSLTTVVSHHAQPITLGSSRCFTTSSRIHDIFPLVSFNFDGGKSMIVKPEDYLIRLTNMCDAKTWCIGFKKIEREARTILGAFLTIANSLPTVMKLERAIPMGSSLKDLQSRDDARHGRTRTGVVNFPLDGSSDLNKAGRYITKLKIGSPPREYRLRIDSGSGLSWVSCIGCDGYPTSYSSGIQLQFYNPNSSSSASTIACSDKRCAIDSIGQCNSQPPRRSYLITYVDHSVTTGHLISDVFHLPTITAGSTTHFSTSVLFGKVQTASDTAYDELLGLDPSRLSLISQLSSPIFSHCLSEGEDGGCPDFGAEYGVYPTRYITD